MAAFEPELFGKYVLLSRLATGGMAEIFRATSYGEGGFESRFVIKRVRPERNDDAAFIDLFISEARISVQLQHPNVVRVFDFGREQDHYYIAMELVEGRDLRRVLRAAQARRESVPVPLALHLVAEACKGLHYAHTRTGLDGRPLGVVHRDVSPSNLLCTWQGDLKVVDFGIATDDLDGEEDGGVKGKYAYMAPEQADGRPVDARTDVFGLGVVLFELLTGRRAFPNVDGVEALRTRHAEGLPRVSQLVHGVPPGIDAVVTRATALDPAARFASAREMGEALRRALPPGGEDALREQLGAWLRHLFADELVEEAAAAAETAALGRALWEAASAELPAPRSERGRLLGMLAVAAAGVMLVIGALGWSRGVQAPVPEVAVAATGSLAFDLSPAARVLLSGRPAGEGAAFTVGELAPGEYEVRIEADGHRPLDEKLVVTRGAVTRVRRALEPLPADAPAVQFTSRPSGATVLVDGRPIGTTPLSWREGVAGQGYAVELRLDGHAVARGRVEVGQKGSVPFFRALTAEGVGRAVTPTERPTAPVERPAAPSVKPTPPADDAPAAAAGALKVVLLGATWANVWIDGSRISKNAPFSAYSLKPGSYTVRVENAGAGLDHTQKVTISPGASVTVRAAVD